MKNNKENVPIMIPECMTKNYKFLKPQYSSGGRRQSEKQKIDEVNLFFKSIGFKTEVTQSSVLALGKYLENEVNVYFY